MAYYFFFPDDFGLRSPIIQKTFQTKTATSISIVTRVENRLRNSSKGVGVLVVLLRVGTGRLWHV